MNKINIIYLKELGNLDEIFEKTSKLPLFLKRVILIVKKIFCIVTVNEEKVFILPYKELEKFSKLKLILVKKILLKLNGKVVLSNYLNKNDKLKEVLKEANIPVIQGDFACTYLLPEIIDYICDKMGVETEKQEITLLVQNKSKGFNDLVIELATNVKRIHIVTNRITQFERLENDLESILGVGCRITNNKRKSLLKSNLIVNFDYSEEALNEFIINPNAIIIDIIEKVSINAKAFCGIHIYDYEISASTKNYAEFQKKKVLEAELFGKNYTQARSILKQNNIKIQKLVGKNGKINVLEYKNIGEKIVQNT